MERWREQEGGPLKGILETGVSQWGPNGQRSAEGIKDRQRREGRSRNQARKGLRLRIGPRIGRTDPLSTSARHMAARFRLGFGIGDASPGIRIPAALRPL